MFQKILKLALRHKIIAVIVIIVLAVGIYYGYKSFKGGGGVQYVLAAVEKGTVTVSVSGSGQVSASNRVDIKAKVSGDVVYVGAKNGQEVKAWTLLIEIDSRDAQKAVRDAEITLERAKLELEKMKGLVTDAGNIRGLKEKAVADLEKAYDDGFNTVANAFLELPPIMAGLQNMLFTSSLNSTQWNIDYYANSVKNYDEKSLQYRDNSYQAYQSARTVYDKNFADYKTASRFSDKTAIETLINETYDTTKNIAEAVKNANNLIQFYKDKLSERGFQSNVLADTHLTQLNSYTSKTNSYLLSLLSIKNTVQNNKETLVNVDFDIADQKINVTQAENSLSEAKEKLADYFIRAPFAGVVAEMNVKKGDSVSGAVATFITKQRIAEISLNEVDVAKVKTGQKAVLTFDAVSDLNLTGEVAEINAIGTVSQGVVSYVVKITFDAQDERIKPGMSVSAAIITDVRQNALIAPNAAVKQQNGSAYVEIMENNQPQRRSVETGLTNDTVTEIVSGLKEGEQVVTQTIASNATQTKSSTNSNLRIPGVTGGGMR